MCSEWELGFRMHKGLCTRTLISINHGAGRPCDLQVVRKTIYLVGSVIWPIVLGAYVWLYAWPGRA